MPCASAQLRSASSASWNCVALICPPGPRSTYASRWAGSTRRVSSGNCAASSSAASGGDRPAPFDRPVAVRAHLAPVDAERGALPAPDSGQLLVADEGDELLAERPQARCIDVALQAQQAALRHFPGRDLVHNSAPSGEPVNEGGDEFPLSGVPVLGFPPERRHPLSHLRGAERQQLFEGGERDPHLAEGRDQPCLSELGVFVVAVAGKLIDAGWRQQTKPVIEAPCVGPPRIVMAPSPLAAASVSAAPSLKATGGGRR